MITGRMLTGNFVYVFGATADPTNPVLPDPATAKYARKRQKILKEFEVFARSAKQKGLHAYGAIYNFPTESGARSWVGSKKLPEVADLTITASSLGRALVARR